jgi:hypothetical protein
MFLVVTLPPIVPVASRSVNEGGSKGARTNGDCHANPLLLPPPHRSVPLVVTRDKGAKWLAKKEFGGMWPGYGLGSSLALGI